MTLSRIALALATLATAAAAYWAPEPNGNVVAPTMRQGAHGTASDIAPSPARESTATRTEGRAIEVSAIQPRDRADDSASVFSAAQWDSPARVEAVAPREQPTAPAQAPPLPFRVLGRYVEDGKVAVFLQFRDQNLVVRAGDTVAGHYTVERIEGSAMTLLYVPLKQRQTMDVGAVQ
jgi:hypothetical protein